MRIVQASEAKTHLLGILDEVERGETVVITRHGREIATLSPRIEARTERVKSAFANLQVLREIIQPMSIGEILAARDEGRR